MTRFNVLSPSSMPDPASDYEAMRERRSRWRVLAGTFCLSLAVGLLFVWLRPPEYQSLSILHFSYPQPLAGDLNSLAAEQVAIQAQRLESNRALQAIQAQLQTQGRPVPELEDLARMLRAEALPGSRLLRLTATSSERDLLLPVMSAWIETFLHSRDREQAGDEADAIAVADSKIAALEQRLADKRRQLASFSDSNRIVSLERDENRVLNKLQGLAAALDTGIEEQATASATLESLRTAMAAGELPVRPQDQASIDRLEDQALAIEQQLRDLGLQYTEQYMDLDPKMVALRRSLERARATWAERRRESQRTYLHEADQALATANGKVADLQQQMADLEIQAREFNSKLVEFRALDQELADLEKQVQVQKQQRVELEVQKPYEAAIDVLEQPFAPDFPSGPPYWRDTGIALAGALLLSLLALAVYTAIQGGRRTSLIFAAPYQVQPPAQRPALEGTASAIGIGPTGVPALGRQAAATFSRQEVRQLFDHANSDGRCLLALVLSGVAIPELALLTGASLEQTSAGSSLAVGGHFARRLPLTAAATASLATRARHSPADAMLQQPTGAPLSRDDLQLLLHQAALEAELADPDRFTLENLRLTYLAYLVDQGCRLNQLEQLAGHVPPAELALLRGRDDPGRTWQPLAAINSRYPLAGNDGEPGA